METTGQAIAITSSRRAAPEARLIIREHSRAINVPNVVSGFGSWKSNRKLLVDSGDRARGLGGQRKGTQYRGLLAEQNCPFATKVTKGEVICGVNTGRRLKVQKSKRCHLQSSKSPCLKKIEQRGPAHRLRSLALSDGGAHVVKTLKGEVIRVKWSGPHVLPLAQKCTQGM